VLLLRSFAAMQLARAALSHSVEIGEATSKDPVAKTR
jgi:hypothetical protein